MPDGHALELARQFRKEPTLAEELLWKRLRAYRLTGLKFRRQHPLGGAIADFYCAERRLVIEVDGEIHNYPENRERDEVRDEVMRSRDLTVLRFTNDQVLNDLEAVLNEILAANA
jgi:very-short-patch-repair endonuclease